MSADTAHVAASESPVVAEPEATRASRRKLALAVVCVLSYAALISVPTSTALPPAAQRGGGPAASPRPAPTVLNLGSFVVAVQDLERSLRFYRDGLGLTVMTPPDAAVVDAPWSAVVGTSGARVRRARLAIANEPFALELIEYTGIERTGSMAHHNDPGSSFLNFGYVDIAATFEALRPFAPRMVGSGTFPPPINPGGGFALAWIRDPDGQMIEVMRGGWDSDRKPLASVRNLYRAHFGITLENYRQALAFYRDLLGFELDMPMGPAIGEYRPAGDNMARLLGVPATANFTGVGGHCAGARCEMFEFKDAPRTAFAPRPQDAGAAMLSLWVSDLDALLTRMRDAGIVVSTPGGRPVDVKHVNGEVVTSGNPQGAPVRATASRQILVRDPAGFPVLLMQRTN